MISRACYLRFDLSLLPPNRRVRSVIISATAYTGVGHWGDGNVYTTFVPNDGWYEGSITPGLRLSIDG
ncbi:hypothetical protein MYXA107069_01965 [Myxococcus xanthus]|nr:hypothetical protein MyxoNM_11985 [Myxococcus xanthus]SDX02826.1 hypothetical protein SAMN05444383_104633 [Myxococcus xanthus]